METTSGQKSLVFYVVLSTKGPKSDGLARAFQGKVQPNQGFGVVEQLNNVFYNTFFELRNQTTS